MNDENEPGMNGNKPVWQCARCDREHDYYRNPCGPGKYLCRQCYNTAKKAWEAAHA
jgi:ribosomal protein S14